MIGVVADARINGLKDNAAMVYLPYWAYTPLTLSFLVRSSQSERSADSGDAADDLAASIRRSPFPHSSRWTTRSANRWPPSAFRRWC